MIHGTVGTAELATGKTELGDLHRALTSDVSRAVMVDLDQLEVVEYVAVEVECCSRDSTLERQERSEPLGHVTTLTSARWNGRRRVTAYGCTIASDSGNAPWTDEGPGSELTPMGQVDSIGSFARGLGPRRTKIAIGVAGAIVLLVALIAAVS